MHLYFIYTKLNKEDFIIYLDDKNKTYKKNYFFDFGYYLYVNRVCF